VPGAAADDVTSAGAVFRRPPDERRVLLYKDHARNPRPWPGKCSRRNHRPFPEEARAKASPFSRYCID